MWPALATQSSYGALALNLVLLFTLLLIILIILLRR